MCIVEQFWLGLFVLPSEGVPAEEVARNAVEELTNNLQYESCVDEHLQDQVSLQRELYAWTVENYQYCLNCSSMGTRELV